MITKAKKQFFCVDCEKPLKKYYAKRCSSCYHSSRPVWNKGKTGVYTKEVLEKILAGLVHEPGENHPMWKGGRNKDSYGYVHIYSKNHPNRDKKGYVREHRLVVEKAIGRMLIGTEIVHHVNSIKNDNRIENLMAFSSNSAHRRFHHKESSVSKKEIVFDGRKI